MEAIIIKSDRQVAQEKHSKYSFQRRNSSPLCWSFPSMCFSLVGLCPERGRLWKKITIQLQQGWYSLCAGLRCILSLPWKHRSCRASVSFQIRTTVFVYTLSFFPLKHKGKLHFFLRQILLYQDFETKLIFLKTNVGFGYLTFKIEVGRCCCLVDSKERCISSL